MYLVIFVKTVFIYFFIAFMFRIMGKKELGQLSLLDLIVSIMIAELGALTIDKVDQSILISVIPIVIIVLIQILMGYISLKNTKIRNVVDGKPVVIIKNGKLNFKEMTKLRYTLDDLVSQLREQGYQSIEEVSYAVLENNGKLSVFEDTKEYPLPIILDGILDEKVLKEINKDTVWLYKILKKHSVKLENVFYAFQKGDQTYIIKKNELL
jgi:Predicted membrane protein